MAVRHGYGKIAGTDALVFAYDTGDTRNSYRGEPTVNYIAHQNAVAQSSYVSYSATSDGTWNVKHSNAIRAYNIDGGDITGYVNTGVGDWTNTYHAHWQYDAGLGKPVTVMQALDGNWKAKSFGAAMGAWSALGVSAGQQYTISWLQWTSDLNLCADTGFYSRNTSNTWGFHDGRSNGNSKNTLLNTWQRVSYTFTVNAVRNLNDSNGNVYMYGHTTSNAGGTLKIADVQLEFKDHATQFTGLTSGTSGRTTRLATQGLVDLTGNSTINLANVSFDSNAKVVWDGTNDFISLENLTWGTGLTGVTLEFVVKSQANNKNLIKSDGNGILLHYNGAGFYLNSPDNNTSGYLGWNGKLSGGTGVYEHLIATWDGTTMKLYVNGVSTGTTLAYTAGISGVLRNLTGVRIGDRFNDTQPWFNGDVLVTKVYNRALTAAEVLNNYNQYKGRFNL